jgi:hypothetical protein
LFSIGPMRSKRMNRPRSCDNFSSMGDSSPNYIFLSGREWNAPTIQDQRITTLHHDHVFVIVVRVFS